MTSPRQGHTPDCGWPDDHMGACPDPPSALLRRSRNTPWRYSGSTGKSLACERHKCEDCTGWATWFRRCYDGCHNAPAGES